MISDEARYERYKSALRTGHVAAGRGRLDAALAAYREAAALAPDRSLPHVGIGRALLGLGRIEEALTAFATALRWSSRDEGALAGRAEALVAAARPAEAAGVLDLLADVQEAAGRITDACDTARRALELAESRARRRHLEALVAQLRASPAEMGREEQLAQALLTLEAPVGRVIDTSQAASGGTVEAVDAVERVDTAEPAGTAEPVETVEVGPAEAPPAAVLRPDAVPAEAAPPEAASPEEPAREHEPPIDPDAIAVAVEAAIASGDPVEVRAVVLAGVTALRRARLLDAAFDACQLALTVAPSDPDIHLALAQLDLDHGWTAVAADKLAILGRLIELTGDAAARERLCAVVRERLPDDPRLATVCA